MFEPQDKDDPEVRLDDDIFHQGLIEDLKRPKEPAAFGEAQRLLFSPKDTYTCVYAFYSNTVTG